MAFYLSIVSSTLYFTVNIHLHPTVLLTLGLLTISHIEFLSKPLISPSRGLYPIFTFHGFLDWDRNFCAINGSNKASMFIRDS